MPGEREREDGREKSRETENNPSSYRLRKTNGEVKSILSIKEEKGRRERESREVPKAQET